MAASVRVYLQVQVLKRSLQEFTQTSPQIDFQVLNNTPSYSFWILYTMTFSLQVLADNFSLTA